MESVVQLSAADNHSHEGSFHVQGESSECDPGRNDGVLQALNGDALPLRRMQKAELISGGAPDEIDSTNTEKEAGIQGFVGRSLGSGTKNASEYKRANSPGLVSPSITGADAWDELFGKGFRKEISLDASVLVFGASSRLSSSEFKTVVVKNNYKDKVTVFFHVPKWEDPSGGSSPQNVLEVRKIKIKGIENMLPNTLQNKVRYTKCVPGCKNART